MNSQMNKSFKKITSFASISLKPNDDFLNQNNPNNLNSSALHEPFNA
jgi:hypothetical protein